MTSIAVIFRRKRFFRPAEDTTHREELSCSSAEPVGRPQPEAGAQIGLGGGRLRRGLAQPRCLQGGDDLGDQADAEFELFVGGRSQENPGGTDPKSTRLNSSHVAISYA